MAGLFDIFTASKRGLTVQQGALNATSHNIANANTQGYSRQRAVIETTRPFGGASRFDTYSAGQMGTGAEVTTIQRVRDFFVDYQVRSETGASGYYTSISETLTKVQNVFAEPSDKGIQELMTKFYNAFQEVSKNPGSQDVRAAAIKQASALADQINYAYNQLEVNCNNNQKILQNNVTDANSYLDQINELNKQIRSVSAVGMAPNDLMDRRDNLLDQLSSKFGIKLDRDKLDTINLSSTEYPDSMLVKSDPNDINYSRFSYVKSAEVTGDTTNGYDIKVEYYPLGNEKAQAQSFEFHSNDKNELEQLKESYLQNRILIADKDGNAIIKTPSSAGVANIMIKGGTLGTNVDTLAENTGKITLTFTDVVTSPATPTPKKIVIEADGTVSTNDPSYQVTKNSDGTMYIKVSSNVTIQVGKDGSLTARADDLKQTSTHELKTDIFETYKYESDINNVDNNNIKGEMAGNQSVQDNLKKMMNSLDRLAAGLAYSVNAIQTGSIDPATTSNNLQNTLIFVNKDTSTATSKTDTGITAKNIKINSEIITNPEKLNCYTTSTSGEGDGKRAAAIANLGTLKMKISDVGENEDLTKMTRDEFLTKVGINAPSGSTGFTDGTCLSLNAGTDGSTTDSYYKSAINDLGVETQEAFRKAGNQEVILAKLEDDRMQVSGVSLDEETANLIQFQHAYQANAKMIATINELLDVVINGLIK